MVFTLLLIPEGILNSSDEWSLALPPASSAPSLKHPHGTGLAPWVTLPGLGGRPGDPEQDHSCTPYGG